MVLIQRQGIDVEWREILMKRSIKPALPCLLLIIAVLGVIPYYILFIDVVGVWIYEAISSIMMVLFEGHMNMVTGLIMYPVILGLFYTLFFGIYVCTWVSIVFAVVFLRRWRLRERSE